jgi:Zn-dependent protease
MLDLLNNPLYFAIYAASLIVAITVHEFAHAWTANRLGDPTPKLQGRLTLNPLSHLDPLGTLMLLIVGFGWGKPVQFDPYNLQNPRKEAALISIAGPVSNVIIAIIASALVWFLGPFSIISAFIIPFIRLNILLAVFNLIPVHPLDGGKILVGILPQQTAHEVESFLNQFGMIILLLIILPFFGGTPLVYRIVSPITNFIYNILLPYGGVF